MGALQDATQKLKGQAQKAKGDIETEAGHPIRGTVDKIKGHVNETIADANIQSRVDNRN